MSRRFSLVLSGLMAVLPAIASPLALTSIVQAQDTTRPPTSTSCTVDLHNPGLMKDIVSNALIRGVGRAEADVAAFLRAAETRFATGELLLAAAAEHFAVERATLAAEVERFRHCNCSHAAGTAAPDHGGERATEAVTVNAFAKDVLLHVVLHELGHALVREFDLPVLGNEETMADAFATCYLTAHLPDRAAAVLAARTASLLQEANAVPREQWDVCGEHDNDARRAAQIAALAVAADAKRYADVAKRAGLSDKDVKRATDYGAEIHRSWRRVLAPLRMPADTRSAEARVLCDPTHPVFGQLHALGLVAELEAIVTGFDWHSQVTVRFAPGDGGAAWSRGSRTVTVHEGYVRRFVAQGHAVQR